MEPNDATRVAESRRDTLFASFKHARTHARTRRRIFIYFDVYMIRVRTPARERSQTFDVAKYTERRGEKLV